MPTALPRPSIRRLVFCAGLLTVCPSAARAQAASADSAALTRATLSGSVLDRQGDAPIAGARLLLQRRSPGSPASLIEADSVGAFEFPPVPAGPYTLLIRQVGYRDLVQELELGSDVRTELTASLVPDAVDLDPVIVTVERTAAPLLPEFEARRALGIGTFITREDVERRRPMRVSDLFRTVPGVRVVSDRLGDAHLMLRGRCTPKVYMDGVATSEDLSIDLSLRPVDIEGIEVYSNATAPVEYGREACGVILVWTRVPQRVDGSAPWWKPLLLLGALFGTFNLLR